MSLNQEETEILKDALRQSMLRCSERGLYQSAKWSAELLNSVPDTLDPDLPGQGWQNSATDSANPRSVTAQNNRRERELEAKELPNYLLAKSFFDCREYDRCASVFLKSTFSQSTPKFTANKAFSETGVTRTARKISQRSFFLALYAMLMAGEKRKAEECGAPLSQQDVGTVKNERLSEISFELEGWFRETQEKSMEDSSDGWLEYLYGAVLAKRKNEEEAIRWLLRSVNLYPWHWGAWEELSALISSSTQLDEMLFQLRPNIMSFIFSVYTRRELYQTTENLHQDIKQLESIFPSSAFLQTQRALLHFSNKEDIEAEAIFSEVLKANPHRMDSLDKYSNILRVLELDPKLSFLAQLTTMVDQFRPEACYIMGNYYSQIGQHEKAILSFKKALTLDRSFASAWTVLGHEFLEVQNTHAAIESYRRAVDIDRKDYRAWRGLGHTYEALELSNYSVYYYSRAALLHPHDPTMWKALGLCLFETDKPNGAIKALKRALALSTATEFGSSAKTSYMISLLYEKIGKRADAIAYMQLCLVDCEKKREYAGENGEGMETLNDTMLNAQMLLAEWTVEEGQDT